MDKKFMLLAATSLALGAAACEERVPATGPLCESSAEPTGRDIHMVRRAAREMAKDGVTDAEVEAFAVRMRGCNANSVIMANWMSQEYNPGDTEARELTSDAMDKYVEWAFTDN